MAIVIQSIDEETIALPIWLMNLLEIQEGDEIRTVMNGNTLQLTPLEKFLALRGVWANDSGFDEAVEFLEQAWQEWESPVTAQYPQFPRPE